MINEKYAIQYCAEDISKIENYEQAAGDDSQVWDIHHRAEILHCGRFSMNDLKKFGLYWRRPASELIFLTRAEHRRLHRTGQHLSEDTRRKLSEARKLSEVEKRTPVEQYSRDGTFIATYPSTREAMRKTGTFCGHIVRCCKGRCRSAGGYVWKYAAGAV